jgi:hypothetical protein
MDRRTELLRRLAEFQAAPRSVLAELSAFPWDPPSDEPLVVVTAEHFRSVLGRYLSGDISAQDVEDWASCLECREDVGFEPERAELLMDFEFRLASPEINGEISHAAAAEMLKQLDRTPGGS